MSRLTSAAADERARDRREAHHRTEHAERLLLALVAEELADQAEPCGTMIAATAPWSARPAISAPGDGASEHSTEAATKPPIPTSSTRRRPNRSPSRLPSMSVTAIASV